MRYAAVIVAAGSGSRMGGAPKQWRSLLGRPVLAWSLETFAGAGATAIVLVVAAAEIERAQTEFSVVNGLSIIAGGATRTESVRAGLAALVGSEVEAVLVHDAARPLVNRSHVQALLKALQDSDGAILAEPVIDTLKRAGADGAIMGTAEREGLWRAQTPQAFRLTALAAAYARASSW